MSGEASNSASVVTAADALLRAAFKTGAEADLVARLRTDQAMATEIAVFGGNRLLGYAALSWMTAPEGWLCLAPVAVAPDAQGGGIGGQVVELALNWAAGRDAFVVVLGDPNYYGARGFSAQRAARLSSPYPVEHTLLAGPGDDAPAEALVYPAAFAET